MSERPIDDVPEADAIEQSQPTTEEPARPAEELDEVGADAPEADVLEQAAELPEDDEEPA
jgi:hypothetical protein